MMQTKNKFVLPIIIILLIIFTPASIYGTYQYISIKKEGGNPDHQAKIDNVLYFYDTSDKLIGMYTCENYNCDRANSKIDDEYLDYYQGQNNQMTIYQDNNNDYYTFINDNNIKLVKLNKNSSDVIISFKSIKNYGTSLEDNLLFVQNLEGDYGILSLDTFMIILSPSYNFLGLSNYFENNVLSTSYIAAQKDEKWMLITKDNNVLTKEFDLPIFAYNKNLIIFIQDSKYYITDFNGSLLWNQEIDSIKLNEDYVIFNSDNNLYVYSNDMHKLYATYEIEDGYTFDVNDQKLDIIDGNKSIVNSVELNKLETEEITDNSSFVSASKEVTNKAIEFAKTAYNNKYVSDEQDICVTVNYLKQNSYISNTNVTGSVYIEKSNDDYKAYLWLSDNNYILGYENNDNFIGGASSEYLEKYPIIKGYNASSTCSTYSTGENIQYFN